MNSLSLARAKRGYAIPAPSFRSLAEARARVSGRIKEGGEEWRSKVSCLER
jgi:hypothetical protein